MKNFFGTCLIFWAFSLSAQHVKQGESYSFEKNFYPICMPGFYNNSCVLIRANADERNHTIKDLRVEFFDTSSLKLSQTWSLNGIFEDKQAFFPEDIRLWNKQICVFGSSFDKQNKLNTLHALIIDSLGNIGKKIQLQTSETNHFDIKNKRFHIAGESKKDILAIVSLNESDDRGIPKLSLSVYDQNFKEFKSLNTYLPFQGKRMGIEDMLLDEQGNVHLLVKGFKSNDSLDIVYSVFAFPVMNDEVLEYQLNIPGKIISSLKMHLDQDEKLLISGLLRDESQKSTQISSLFFLRINREKGTIEDKGIQRMDNEFKSLFIGYERIPAMDDFSEYKTQRIIPSGKGGILLVAEKISREEIYEPDYRTGIEMCHTFFRAGNILIVSYNERAEIDWYQTINKDQETQNDDGHILSFLDLSSNSGTTHYYFNHFDLEKEKFKNTRLQKSKLFEVTLGGNGQMTTQFFQIEKPIIPSLFFKPNNRTTYTIGQSNGSAELIRIVSQ